MCILPAVKHWASRLVALTLLWVIFPGSLEATENLAHILANGHLAHAEEAGDSHSDPGPEHGCNGVFHLCSCHLTPLGRLTDSQLAPTITDEHALPVDRSSDRAFGHQHDIEHPPQS